MYKRQEEQLAVELDRLSYDYDTVLYHDSTRNMTENVSELSLIHIFGEYAGFKMAVSFDFFNHKFVMNIKGQLSHCLLYTSRCV